MKLFLDDFFKAAWRGSDPFAEVEKLDGELFRNIKNRRTLKFLLNGRSWFLKHHRGVGWREIFKNLICFKAPVLGAGNEYRAIRRLEELKIHTMYCGAYGERGVDPARRESFIITAEIENAESLEEVAARPVDPPLKRKLIGEVASISRTLHDHGINHRDYYLCHFLLSGGLLHLIDLHRVQIRRKIPARYLFKDMGGLWFSAMDANLSRADRCRFIAAYAKRPLRLELSENSGFWRRVNRVGTRLYRREFGRDPAHVSEKDGK